MSAEEVASQLMRVDKQLRDGKDVPEAEKSINITTLYRRYKWGGAGPTPLLDDAQKRLNIQDRSADSRWMQYFNANGRHLGVYRTQVGYYWLLRFDGAIGQHFLDHVGTAADVEERFGKK